MIYDLIILPNAQNDIRITAIWYNTRKSGLGLKFTKVIRNELSRVRKNPLAFINRYKTIHTISLKKYPFLIHYLVDVENKKVLVTAVFHTSLNPIKWDERMK